ncbi:hypothetical protein BC936DRAFT_139404 [Jimgerdemannia flammicorona]|uniref:Uncharacterized protein n=1 Tax=Jimgerdemannia flammicorona TaxID=994334 RepID=A0A433B9Z1_9FUNG|nr:hypothetical protein BC936DRAFT_139404 [Jimgerdemannia flammicorona]
MVVVPVRQRSYPRSDLLQDGHQQPPNPAEMDKFCEEHGFARWFVIAFLLSGFISLLSVLTTTIWIEEGLTWERYGEPERAGVDHVWLGTTRRPRETANHNGDQFETSAKDNSNIDEAARYLVQSILEIEEDYLERTGGVSEPMDDDGIIRMRVEPSSNGPCC